MCVYTRQRFLTPPLICFVPFFFLIGGKAVTVEPVGAVDFWLTPPTLFSYPTSKFTFDILTVQTPQLSSRVIYSLCMFYICMLDSMQM